MAVTTDRKFKRIEQLEKDMSDANLKVLKREYKEARRMCEGYPELAKHWDKKLKELELKVLKDLTKRVESLEDSRRSGGTTREP